jgi:Homeodomain-like domain-containing protein
MRKALPVITEAVENLKQRLQREHDGRTKPRLQMLYWLASGQAQRRQEVTRLLGVHRNTIGHWLARYEAGGLEALLAPCMSRLASPCHCPPTCWSPLSTRSPGGQLSHSLHDRPHPVQREAQGTAAQSHPKTLRPLLRFRRPVASSYSVSARRRIPARCACSARTKAAWAC